MPLLQFVVDAFTDRPFAGNPAAVVLLDRPAGDAWLQALAAENNLSETAYLVPNDQDWNLRWFTPTVEVELCGHATLAAAHVLFTELDTHREADLLSFTTRSGRLTATRQTGGWIVLDFPADRSESVADEATVEAILDALGIETADAVLVGRSDYLVVVPSSSAVLSCQPDHRALAALAVRGVILTAQIDGVSAAPLAGHDVVSRFFAPASGIDEDPVTGSAHCQLGPFWASQLGRTQLRAYQASQRGGTIRVDVRGDRVGLAGQAVTIARTELTEAVSSYR